LCVNTPAVKLLYVKICRIRIAGLMIGVGPR